MKKRGFAVALLSALLLAYASLPVRFLVDQYASELWSNNAKSTLTSGINNSVTSVTVASGSNFPSPTGADYFWATLDDGSNIEIVKVTARSSNTMTVTRAQQGTSAHTFSAGTRFELRVTKQTLEDLQTAASGGAPTDATYITQTANGSLSAEQALGSLSTGYMKVTTTTGVVSSQTVPIPVGDGGTGATTFSSNLPLIGVGGSAITTGTRSGNSTAFVTTTGTQTSGDCVEIDANGNHIAAGAPCGSGGSGDVATDGIWDAKGDLAAGTGANAADNLTVGSNGQMLIADSTQTTGLKWITLASDKKVITSGDKTTTSGTFADVDGTNMAITMTTGARRVMIAVVAMGHINDTHEMMLDIDIDGSRQGQTYGLSFETGSNTVNHNLSFTYVTDVLSAGSHTFKLQFARTTNGTFTLFASTTISPLIMSAVELPN